MGESGLYSHGLNVSHSLPTYQKRINGYIAVNLEIPHDKGLMGFRHAFEDISDPKNTYELDTCDKRCCSLNC